MNFSQFNVRSPHVIYKIFHTIAWENAIPLGGKSSDVYCFDMVLSIGDISGDGISESHKEIFKKSLSVYCYEDLEHQITEKMNGLETALSSVLKRYIDREEVRICYSYNPDELCGMYWIMKQLQPLKCKTSVYIDVTKEAFL